jgi:hypothetical protein
MSSGHGSCRATISMGSPNISSHGDFTIMPKAVVTSGLMRNRKWSGIDGAGNTCGGLRKRITSSVQVTGKLFPARM